MIRVLFLKVGGLCLAASASAYIVSISCWRSSIIFFTGLKRNFFSTAKVMSILQKVNSAVHGLTPTKLSKPVMSYSSNFSKIYQNTKSSSSAMTSE